MRKILDKQLTELHADLGLMSQQVHAAVKDALAAFLTNDHHKAHAVIDGDAKINDLEVQLEKKAAQVIALQQPVAADLRVLITILKASSEFERMGDHAVSIAKAALHASKEQIDNADKIESILAGMADRLMKMLAAITQAYATDDAVAAKAVAADDIKIDELYHQLRELTILTLTNTPAAAPEVIDYRSVGRHLERIGDYITNVAEWIVYVVEGKIVELGND